eukprot:6172724-Pleurochrysis_carterae.AAC.2
MALTVEAIMLPHAAYSPREQNKRAAPFDIATDNTFAFSCLPASSFTLGVRASLATPVDARRMSIPVLQIFQKLPARATDKAVRLERKQTGSCTA